MGSFLTTRALAFLVSEAVDELCHGLDAPCGPVLTLSFLTAEDLRSLALREIRVLGCVSSAFHPLLSKDTHSPQLLKVSVLTDRPSRIPLCLAISFLAISFAMIIFPDTLFSFCFEDVVHWFSLPCCLDL